MWGFLLKKLIFLLILLIEKTPNYWIWFYFFKNKQWKTVFCSLFRFHMKNCLFFVLSNPFMWKKKFSFLHIQIDLDAKKKWWHKASLCTTHPVLLTPHYYNSVAVIYFTLQRRKWSQRKFTRDNTSTKIKIGIWTQVF